MATPKSKKGFLARVREKIGLGKAEDRASIEYLTYHGFLEAQLEGIPESDEDIIEQSARFARSLIPFLNTRKDRRMHKMLVYYLSNYEAYQEIKRTHLGLDNNGYVTKDEKDIRDSQLDYTIKLLKDIMVTDGKVLQSMIYEKVDHRTLVLNKPYILGMPNRPRFFDPSLEQKSGTGSNRFYPSEMKSGE